MSPIGPALAAGAIGPTAFTLLAWGSILLVALAFVYLVRTLVVDRRGN